MRKPGQVEILPGTYLRSLFLARQRPFKRELGLGLDDQQRIGQVGREIDVEPGRQAFHVDAPAFRHIIYLPGQKRCSAAPVFYHVIVTVDGQRLAFREDPASCAARLFVQSKRNIHGDDDIGEIHAYTGIGLIASDAIPDPIIARPEVEQQRIIIAGGPGA